MQRLLQMIIKSTAPAQPREERLNNAVATALLFRQDTQSHRLYSVGYRKSTTACTGLKPLTKGTKSSKFQKNINLIKNAKKPWHTLPSYLMI